MDYISPFIKWLLLCDGIKNKKLFLDAVKAEKNNVGIVTHQIAENTIKKYIDGSKSYPITFTITDYKSISYNQLPKTNPQKNENISNLIELNEVVEFVKRMEKEKMYPDFGENIEVQRIRCEYQTPPSPTIDGSFSPPLAKYSLPIVCEVYEDV